MFILPVGVPLTDGDTAFYGKIARNILASGDWQTLHYLGDDFVDKPPLSIWPMAVSYKLFGVHDWSTRAWHSLLAACCIVLTYFMALAGGKQKAAFLSAAVLATSVLFFYMGQVPQQDVPLVFFSLLAFYGFQRYRRNPRISDIILISAAVGAAVLTRGLQGLVFPMAVMALFLAARFFLGKPLSVSDKSRGKKTFSLSHFLAGTFVFIVVAVPWFYLGYRRQGPDFLIFFFGAGNTRYLKEIAPGSSWDLLSYFPLLLLAFLPWSGLVYHSLREAWRKLRHESDPAARDHFLFLFAWFFVAFFLPFLIRWRVIRYLLPALPPLAMMAGTFLDRLSASTDPREYRHTLYLSLIPAVLLLLAVVLALGRFPAAQEAYKPVLLPFLAIYALGIALALVLGFRSRVDASIGSFVCGSILAYLVLWGQLGAHSWLVNPWPPLTSAVNTQATSNDRIIHLGKGPDPFVQLYVHDRVEEITPSEIDGLLVTRQKKTFILADQEVFAELAAKHPSGLRWRTYPGGKVLGLLPPETR